MTAGKCILINSQYLHAHESCLRATSVPVAALTSLTSLTSLTCGPKNCGSSNYVLFSFIFKFFKEWSGLDGSSFFILSDVAFIPVSPIGQRISPVQQRGHAQYFPFQIKAHTFVTAFKVRFDRTAEVQGVFNIFMKESLCNLSQKERPEIYKIHHIRVLESTEQLSIAVHTRRFPCMRLHNVSLIA
jgi:hypothetical protein